MAIVLKALAAAAGAAIVVAAVGLVLRWDTPREFSDGLFWGAGVLALIGFAVILGGMPVRANPTLLYSASAGTDSLASRTRRWVMGVSEDYGVVLTLLLAAIALFSLSMLISALGSVP